MGTGGHCRVILSILFSQKKYDRINIFELENFRQGEKIMGIDVQLLPDDLNQRKFSVDSDFFIAIGDNKKRTYYRSLVTDFNLNTPNLISPGASLDPTTSLGNGNVVCFGAFIGPCATLGDNNLINSYAIIEHECTVQNSCHLAPKSVLCGRSVLGDQCFLGAGSTVIDQLKLAFGTTLGAGSCLLKSVTKENMTYAGVQPVPFVRIHDLYFYWE